MRILAAIVILASLVCGRLAAQAGSGKRFTLSGTVVDGASNRPLAAVEVHLQLHWVAVGNPVMSDAQGRFAFTGLAAGEYILSVQGSFGTIIYGEAPDPGWVSDIQVGSKDQDKSVIFPVFPRASITGTIRDEFGDPMLGANVSVVRPGWRNGKPTVISVMQKNTDDRGRFRFGNLAPANYQVCVDQGATAPAAGPVDYAAHIENRFYVRTCYPGSDGPSARTFPLAPGDQAQIDLTPLIGSLATVSGHVRNAPAQTGFSVRLAPEGGGTSGTNRFGQADAQGNFSIPGVSPGRYRVVADVRSRQNMDSVEKHLTAAVSVDVGGGDVSGLELALDTGGSLDVVFHGIAENQIDPTKVSAFLQGTESSLGAPPEKEGAFHFADVPAGRYSVLARTPPDACVESVKLGDREVRGAPIDISGGAALRVDVTVSKRCGSIRMRAVLDGEAVAGAKAVLLRSGTPKDPGEISEDFVNDEGELSFDGLAPGRYLLWAWAVKGKGAIAGPPSLAAVEQKATVVEVKAGEPTHIDVPLLPEEGKSR